MVAFVSIILKTFNYFHYFKSISTVSKILILQVNNYSDIDRGKILKIHLFFSPLQGHKTLISVKQELVVVKDQQKISQSLIYEIE